jgi:hypothetical protein
VISPSRQSIVQAWANGYDGSSFFGDHSSYTLPYLSEQNLIKRIFPRVDEAEPSSSS